MPKESLAALLQRHHDQLLATTQKLPVPSLRFHLQVAMTDLYLDLLREHAREREADWLMSQLVWLSKQPPQALAPAALLRQVLSLLSPAPERKPEG